MLAILHSSLKDKQKSCRQLAYTSFSFFICILFTFLAYPPLDASLIDPNYYIVPGCEDFKIGQQLFEKGEWEEASPYFKQAIQNTYRPWFDPKDFVPDEYVVDGPNRTRIHHTTSLHYLEYVDQEIRWNIYRHSHFRLGFMHLDRRAFDQARFHFNQAVSFDPSSPKHIQGYFNCVNFIDPFWLIYASLMHLSVGDLETANNFAYLADEVCYSFLIKCFDGEQFWSEYGWYYVEELHDKIDDLRATATISILSMQSLLNQVRGDLNGAIELASQAIHKLTRLSYWKRPHYLSTLYINRGVFYEENGQPQEALQDYTEAIQIFPLRADAYLHRAHLYASLDDYKSALQDYNQVIELDPNNPDWYKQRAFLHYSNRKVELARLDLKMARSIENREFDEALGHGLVCFSKGEYQKSIEYFTKFIEAYPDYAIGYQNRGAAYYQAELFEHALLDFDRALTFTSSNSQLYEMRGLVHLSRGYFEQAEQDLLKAVRLEPHRAHFHQNLAAAYYGQGAFDQALSCYQRAMVLLEGKNAQLSLNSAIIYLEKKDFTNALLHSLEALKLNPSCPTSHLISGLCLYEQGQFEEALKYYQKAIELGCGHSHVYFHRGQTYYRLGLKDQALADFTHAIALDPSYLELYQIKGWLLFELNRVEDFHAHFLKSLCLLCDKSNLQDNLDSIHVFQRGLFNNLLEYEISDVKTLLPLLTRLLLDPDLLTLELLGSLNLKMLDISSQDETVYQTLSSELKKIYSTWDSQDDELMGRLVGRLIANEGTQALHDMQMLQVNLIPKKVFFEGQIKIKCDLKYTKPLIPALPKSLELPEPLPGAIPVYPENCWVMPYHIHRSLTGMNTYPEYSIPCIVPPKDTGPLALSLLIPGEKSTEISSKTMKTEKLHQQDDLEVHKILPSIINLQMVHLGSSALQLLIGE